MQATITAIKKAHKEGCNDVKRVLETLYPKIDFSAKRKFKEGQEVWVKATITSVESNVNCNTPYFLETHDYSELGYFAENEIYNAKTKL